MKLDEPIAIEVAVPVEPSQRAINMRKQIMDKLLIVSPLEDLAGQHEKSGVASAEP